ncbi:Peptidase aspartic [Fusarium albosuccineum]|uniref:Peptidase aspartic n=1 Tax=Fusarium albosuccineum TaxID=1237068 RepID=A0A8H4LDK0_9HYPO|nr:Peptidase aspartic [Fusarium albosuccineum]
MADTVGGRDNNNTVLYGPKCDQDGKEGWCETWRGGFYVPDDSKTDAKTASDYEPLTEPFADNTYDFITETISWASDLTLSKFPILRPVNTSTWNLQGYSPQNLIGMDSGSTIMEALKNAGRISSKSYAFWWGLDGTIDKEQKGGSFVLGGYDKAKVYGDGLTTQLSSSDKCATGMVISISDIVLNFKNGTDVSIFEQDNGGTTLQACITPDVPNVFAMPYDPYFINMGNAIDNYEFSRSVGIDFWNVVLDPDEYIFDGDLTFKLDSSLDITIPNRQLIVPDRTINDDGETISNSSRPVLRINSLQEVSRLAFPYLGRYFLTAAYVVSNEDAGEFTVYQANPTSEEDLVALDEDNKVLSAQATCTVAPTTSADAGEGDGSSSSSNDNSDSNNNGTTNGSSDDSGGGLSTGATAGIAVGVVVPVVAGVGVFIWWLLKRKNAKAAEKEHLQSTAQYMAAAQNEPKNGFPTQGMPHYIPQEMSADNQPRQPPAEMPG